MQKLGYTLLLSLLVLLACGPKSEKEQKLAEYEEAKEKLIAQQTIVHTLKKELLDAGFIEESDNRSLVTAFEIKPMDFERKIEIRGNVMSMGNINISVDAPGKVIKVLAKEGQTVALGQTLVVQDSKVLNNSLAELKTSLELATTIFERQKKLWDQNIGTEVQFLEAKNRKESLERKVSTTSAQLDKTIIRAPFAGVIDFVDVRVGETVQPGRPIIRLVNQSNMYIKAEASEAYIGKFKQGQEVDIYFPSLDKEIQSKISAVGQVIEKDNRSFEVDVQIPSNDDFKSNMISILKIADYSNKKAIAVPTNIIFTDNKGFFVYQLKKSEGSDVAIRTDVVVGITSGTMTEILSGLKENDRVIDKGIYDISSGSQVKVVE